MPKLTVNGLEVEVPAGATVLQACEAAGAEVPRFCYHERLSIAGNCRMCLVEMEKSPKPVASCAMPAGDGMVIHTNTPYVKKAREGVMEFLLINHPLDCPICDQGGECDLQDQSVAYGAGDSRYDEHKRAVEEKHMGPLIKTVMTRCIHCTRCVRFATEIAGVEDLGAVGRGEHMEITTYLEKTLASEVSGNVIDLCPVGALTSKPYAFTARPWELKKTETIDVMDAVGSNIRVDARGNEVMRVLPRLHEDVNEEWISDKTRFVYDGLGRRRLDRPYVRKDGKLQAATWNEAFAAIAENLKGLTGDQIAAIAGDLADAESMFALKSLMQSLGSANLDCRQDGAKLDASSRAGYLFNTGIAGIAEADACLLIGTDPRHEASIINLRLRARFRRGGFKIANVGPALDLTYPVDELGSDVSVLAAIADGSHPFAKVLADAKKPMLIIGQNALSRADGAALLALARSIADKHMVVDGWNGFNVLHTAASRVAGLDLGFVPGAGGRDVAGIMDGAAKGDVKAVFLLGVDEIRTCALKSAFVVYLGTHGDEGVHHADVILPGAAYTEKSGTYVNTEGRVQRGLRAVFAPGDAREDWTILRALSDVIGHRLPFDNLAQLRGRMEAAAPALAILDMLPATAWGAFGTAGTLGSEPLTLSVTDYYMTNPICRASLIMAECRDAMQADQLEATGTHG
ncbi:NADH-quinone oxidoreductase subunit NuoG [Govanella unica]|uniref:NADH-quinone oxidoreductase n=1 Tax=Govanella unica TaxID=2975056 RepID=A0A9X3TXD1_9PROT|nr:NADH-quinone oxidoreductase subunit NuoG [Govania unica]MDA5193745.1 NADH-quinone oxidoreductase subunit NuoG [Govania unica]